MTNYSIYIGQKFNHLQILDFIHTPDHPQRHLRYQFKIRCDCGFEDTKKCNSIINNKIQTCGQYSCSYIMNSPIIAIDKYKKYIGQKINHLTIIDVIYDKDERTAYRYKFKCKCDCGFESNIVISSILANKYQTCGFINCKYSKTSQGIDKYISMIGYKFNKLQITDFIYNEFEKDQYYRWQFKCTCDCGNTEYYTAVDQLLYRTPNGCDKCYTPSKVALNFANWLDDNKIEYLKNQRIDSDSNIQNQIEIDFLINSIGIELHGLSVHSTTNQDFNSPFIGHKPKNYHLNKLISTEIKNIELLQFWNTEFIQKPDIVKSIILNKIGKTQYREYARNCYIKEIDKIMHDEFLNLNHIQGTTQGESVRLGLFYNGNDNLVAVMSFGCPRYAKYQWELFRFSSCIYSHIVGGGTKLFKYFIKYWNPTSIISYSDKRIFNTGKLYEILGFKYLYSSEPNYWYFKNKFSDLNHKLFHRSSFMKHKLKDKLTYFDSNLTEWENMERNNYLRVYDCGNKIYIWTKP
jgi:hypothetical protein